MSADLKNKIIQFFKDNPKPEDSAIHSFAENIGMNKHKFEEKIYEICGDMINKCAAEEIDIPKDELEKGIKVEREHKPTITNLYQELADRKPTEEEMDAAATGITIDHEVETDDLTGKPEYYEEYLLPMEEEMKAEKKESTMRVNSNTIKLGNAEHKELETIIKKIASENNIENVTAVQIKLSQETGIVGFKFAVDEGMPIELGKSTNQLGGVKLPKTNPEIGAELGIEGVPSEEETALSEEKEKDPVVDGPKSGEWDTMMQSILNNKDFIV